MFYNMGSFPSADVISANMVTCKYSLQSMRQRNSLSVGLDKREHYIKNIPPNVVYIIGV